MHPVEVPWFTGPVFIFPVVGGRVWKVFFQVEQLLFFFQVLFGFRSVQGLGSHVGIHRSIFDNWLRSGLLNDFRNEAGACNGAPLLKLYHELVEEQEPEKA
jgi:hypothetical protein